MIARLKLPTIHGIRILKYIANHSGETLVADEISEELGITVSYFMRVVKDLRKAGILKSIQGRYGGFFLNRQIEELTMYDIVEAMEDGEGRMPEEDTEYLTAFLDKLNEYISGVLKETRLIDL